MPFPVDLARYVLEVFENPVTPTVATTATRILRNDPARVAWTAINMSANTGFLGFSSGVSSTQGIQVNASGGSVSAVWFEDGELVTHEVWAINNVAAGTWYTAATVAQPRVR